MQSIIFWAYLLLFTAGSLCAQPELGLRGALDRAAAHNPALAAARDRSLGSRELIRQAGLRPNPRITTQYEKSAGYGGPQVGASLERDTYLYFTQTWETAGKRQRRLDYSSAAAERLESEEDLLRRQTAARVALAYWSAAGASRARDLLAEEVANLKRVVDYTAVRVAEGVSPGADLLRIQLEFQRLEMQYRSAAQEAESTRIQLSWEMGDSLEPGVRLTEPLENTAAQQFPQLDAALQTRPELVLGRRALAQAEANLKLQSANARPDIDVIFGYKRTGPFNTTVAGAQVTLPLFNRNQGQIGSAAAELRAAQSMVRSAENQVRAEWTSAKNEYESRRVLATESLPGMRTRAAEVARIAEGAWREGGIDVIRLLDAQRARIETEVQYTRALVDYQQSVVRFQVAAGVNL